MIFGKLKPATCSSVLEDAIKCDLSEQCGNCPERCNDCNQIADIYNHHPLYRKRDALFDVDDLHIVLNTTLNSSRDPLSHGPSIGIKWMQGGVQYGEFSYFLEDDREPTAAEVVTATNNILAKFNIAANSIATKGCERRDELMDNTRKRKIDRIRELLLEDELLCQLAEECSELAQAALKVKRAMTAKNYTPMGLEEARKNLIEECADVLLCLDVIEYIRKNDYEVAKVMEQKLERWVDRIENTIR